MRMDGVTPQQFADDARSGRRHPASYFFFFFQKGEMRMHEKHTPREVGEGRRARMAWSGCRWPPVLSPPVAGPPSSQQQAVGVTDCPCVREIREQAVDSVMPLQAGSQAGRLQTTDYRLQTWNIPAWMTGDDASAGKTAAGAASTGCRQVYIT